MPVSRSLDHRLAGVQKAACSILTRILTHFLPDDDNFLTRTMQTRISQIPNLCSILDCELQSRNEDRWQNIRRGASALIWLVAEDETDIRMLITTMFQVWGKQAVAYENGQRVWDWLDALEQPGGPSDGLPELVLMDIRMPGKKGNEVARRMRSLPQFRTVPIILMTAFALTEDERREMMTADGVDQIIHKPLPDFEQLRALLHQAVERKARLAETGQTAHEPHSPAR